MSKDCGEFTQSVSGSVRNCATIDIGNCRLSNRMSFSSVIHPAKDQSQCQTLPDSSVSRLHICVERTIAFSLGDRMFDIHSLSLHTAKIVINRFISDSSLRPGDCHPFDVGLTSPTCRFPPDLFLCLGLRKRGVHPDAVAPRRPGLGRGAEGKQQFADALAQPQQHRRCRC